MATGFDKIISYDPPGAIGLFDPEEAPVLQLRLDETETILRPQDVGRRCEDFGTLVTFGGDEYETDLPDVVEAVLGFGRQFDGESTGLVSSDLEPGSTLLTRDLTIQAVLRWDAAGQVDDVGTIIRRGMGTTAPERISYGLVLETTDAASNTGILRWIWEDAGGAPREKDGAAVTLPAGRFTMLTATRRWVSPTLVEMAYYVGGQLAGTATSDDGNIDGSTLGHLLLGYGTDTVGISLEERFAGVLDELMIYGRVLCQEEIEATWLRLTVYQPRGERLFIENHDPRFPLSKDPRSDPRLEQRLWGQALGFAAAQAENMRANFLPHRAYGPTLAQWVESSGVPASGNLSIEAVRNRVLARWRQQGGASPDGMRQALAPLLGGASPEDLEFLSFSNTIRDDFAGGLSTRRWQLRPSSGGWGIVSGKPRCSLVAGDFPFTGLVSDVWRVARMAVEGDARGAHFITKLSLTTAPANLEAGVFFGSVPDGNYLLFGIRNDAGTYRMVSESFVDRVSQGVIQHAVLGGGLNAWVHLWQTPTNGIWRGGVSFTSEKTGYTDSPDLTHPTKAQWVGFYARTAGAIAGAAQVDADSVMLWQPFGTRAFHAYVLLDEGLGFDPDIQGCRAIVRELGHANTHTAFIVKRDTLCDEPESGADLGPMGAL